MTTTMETTYTLHEGRTAMFVVVKFGKHGDLLPDYPPIIVEQVFDSPHEPENRAGRRREMMVLATHQVGVHLEGGSLSRFEAGGEA